MLDMKTGHGVPVQGGDPAPAVIREVLFLAQLPPPLHGASAMSERIHRILAARPDVRLTHLWLGSAASNADVGRRSAAKLVAFARFL